MKIPGLKGAAGLNIPLDEWYLLESTSAAVRDIGTKRAKVEVEFQIVQGQFAGGKFVEQFFLTTKALSRLRHFLSRGGYPPDLLEQDELEEEKITGLRLWAKVTEKEYNGEKSLCISGWEMRSESERPEETQARDYKQRDAEAAAMENLD
jgi:hypothetical protein